MAPALNLLIIRDEGFDIANFGFMNLNISALIKASNAGFLTIKMVLASLFLHHLSLLGDHISLGSRFMSFYLRHKII